LLEGNIESKPIDFKHYIIESKVPSNSGVYIFWFGRRVIYVGQAHDLKQRLLKHWSDTHNNDLAFYIRYKAKILKVTYVIIENQKLFSHEQCYIDKYHPECNKINARKRL
jgi:excinuclease UvrABC nuclease subunit